MSGTLSVLVAISACAVSLQTSASPPSDANTPPHTDEPVALVASGGISLGAYQAGVTYALLADLADNKAKLTTLTGASAGNINAILAALMWCHRAPRRDGVQHQVGGMPGVTSPDNLLWWVWTQMGLKSFLPGDNPDTAKVKNLPGYVDTDGLLARKRATVMPIALIQRDLKRSATIDETLRLGITITPIVPDELSRDDDPPPRPREEAPPPLPSLLSQRRLVFLEVQCSAGDDEPPHLKVFDPSRSDLDKVGRQFKIIFNEADPLMDLAQLVETSSAFPYAFGPLTLVSSPDARDGQSGARFNDGGVFDNTPVGAAALLLGDQRVLKKKDPGDSKYTYYYVNPDLRRGVPPERVRESDSTGLSLAVKTALDFISQSRRYELLPLAGIKDFGKSLNSTSRHFPITGAYLGAFGAFLHQDFRRYDFMVGIYDALVELASKDDQGRRLPRPSAKGFELTRDRLLPDSDENRLARAIANELFEAEFEPLPAHSWPEKYRPGVAAFDLTCDATDQDDCEAKPTAPEPLVVGEKREDSHVQQVNQALLRIRGRYNDAVRAGDAESIAAARADLEDLDTLLGELPDDFFSPRSYSNENEISGNPDAWRLRLINKLARRVKQLEMRDYDAAKEDASHYPGLPKDVVMENGLAGVLDASSLLLPLAASVLVEPRRSEWDIFSIRSVHDRLLGADWWLQSAHILAALPSSYVWLTQRSALDLGWTPFSARWRNKDPRAATRFGMELIFRTRWVSRGRESTDLRPTLGALVPGVGFVIDLKGSMLDEIDLRTVYTHSVQPAPDSHGALAQGIGGELAIKLVGGFSEIRLGLPHVLWSPTGGWLGMKNGSPFDGWYVGLGFGEVQSVLVPLVRHGIFGCLSEGMEDGNRSKKAPEQKR